MPPFSCLQECSNPEREIQATEEAKVRNAASWISILLKAPNAAQQDDGKLQVRPVEESQQQEWRCDLCKVKTTSENDLKAHLRGRIHKANCKSLKAVMLSGKPEHQLKAKEGRIFKGHCNVCDVKMLTEDGFVSHFNRKRHLSNIQKTASPDAALSSS